MSIGTNIKKRRFELRMSQQDLADAMGYKTRSTITKIESGENSVSLKKLEQFASVLDTTVETLVGGIKTTSFGIQSAQQVGGSATAIILAGGKSTRNQQNIPNQFINILGKPVIIYAMEAYQKHPSISKIYVVCLKGWEDITLSYAKEFGITKLAGIIPGGDSGIQSIQNAFEQIKTESQPSDTLIFQESTRPLVSEETISKILSLAKEKGSAVCSKSMAEYMQFMDFGTTSKYMDRNKLVSVQSPEAYTIEILECAFSKAVKEKHDLIESFGAMFMHNMGFDLNFCESNYSNNIKIVRQEDIAIFTALIKSRE